MKKERDKNLVIWLWIIGIVSIVALILAIVAITSIETGVDFSPGSIFPYFPYQPITPQPIPRQIPPLIDDDQIVIDHCKSLFEIHGNLRLCVSCCVSGCIDLYPNPDQHGDFIQCVDRCLAEACNYPDVPDLPI